MSDYHKIGTETTLRTLYSVLWTLMFLSGTVTLASMFLYSYTFWSHIMLFLIVIGFSIEIVFSVLFYFARKRDQ